MNASETFVKLFANHLQNQTPEQHAAMAQTAHQIADAAEAGRNRLEELVDRLDQMPDIDDVLQGIMPAPSAREIAAAVAARIQPATEAKRKTPNKQADRIEGELVMRMRRGEPWTSYRRFMEELKCSQKLIEMALSNNPRLHNWMEGKRSVSSERYTKQNLDLLIDKAMKKATPSQREVMQKMKRDDPDGFYAIAEMQADEQAAKQAEAAKQRARRTENTRE